MSIVIGTKQARAEYIVLSRYSSTGVMHAQLWDGMLLAEMSCSTVGHCVERWSHIFIMWGTGIVFQKSIWRSGLHQHAIHVFELKKSDMNPVEMSEVNWREEAPSWSWESKASGEILDDGMVSDLLSGVL